MRKAPIGSLAALFVLAALAAPTPATAGAGVLVGAVEEDLRAPTLVEAEAKMAAFRVAGFRAVRLTTYWTPGETRPTDDELRVLQHVAQAGVRNGVRVYVTVMNPGSRTTPLTDEHRAQFVSYTTALVRFVPEIRDVIVGNEPNLNRFWLPQFNEDGSSAAPAAYFALLAQTYDALKAISPAIQVYGGAVSPRGTDRPDGVRPTHSPTTFIQSFGTVFRASGRSRPVMDAFVIHVYSDNSTVPPTFAHPKNTSIGVADYDKLVALLAQAFDGTAQPGSTLPILYGEFGVETQIPASKAGAYTGTEPTTTKPVPEETQAVYYEQALGMALCQPNVMGVLLLHARDERDLDRWQSGVYYADGTPKTSLQRVTRALQRTTGGSIARCPSLQLVVKPSLLRFGTRSAAKRGRFRSTFSCDLDCAYRIRLDRADTGRAKLASRGRAQVGELVQVELRARRLAPGPYRWTLELVHPVNPGPRTVLQGRAFRLP